MSRRTFNKSVFNVRVTPHNVTTGIPPIVSVPDSIMEKLATTYNLEYDPDSSYTAFLCIAPSTPNWHECTWTRGSEFWKYFQNTYINIIGQCNYTVELKDDNKPCTTFTILATCLVHNISKI